MLFKRVFALFLIGILISCGFSTEKRRPDAIQNTLSERSVRKISEAEILNKVKKTGDSIVAIAQNIFKSKISEQYKKGGFSAAAAYCSMEAYPLTDSLSKEYNIFLSRVSRQYRNPENAPSQMEESLLEAYEYSHQEGIQLNSNVQFIRPGDTVLYNKPIFISSKLCLNCHGDSKQISADIQQVLKEMYPNDNATGYELGELRGMWSLRFLKKQVVQNL